MAKTKRYVFIAVTALIVAVILILYVKASAGEDHSQIATPNVPPDKTADDTPPANNVSHSTLILKITGFHNVSAYNGSNYCNYDVIALDSNDPAITKGADYSMEIDEITNGYYGMTAGVAPKGLVEGAIVRVGDHNDYNDHYYFDGNNIKVYVGADPYDKNAWDNAWKQKISVLFEPDDINTINDTTAAGAGKIVLLVLNASGHNPFNMSSTNLSPPPNTAAYFNVYVVNSSGPAVQREQDYKLVIEWQMGDGLGSMAGYTPERLSDGTVISIDDYSLDGDTITVVFTGGPDGWTQKVNIIEPDSVK